MKRFVAAAVVFIFGGMADAAHAADDATGTWKWTVSFGGNNNELTLKAKQEGEKLTGTVAGGQNNLEVPTSDGSIKDNKVSFNLVRERNGQKLTSKYSGTLTGDTITGKAEREAGGQVISTDWVAKRQK